MGGLRAALLAKAKFGASLGASEGGAESGGASGGGSAAPSTAHSAVKSDAQSASNEQANSNAGPSEAPPPEKLTDFAQVIKAAVKEFKVPGSNLTIKSSFVAVETAANEILKLYAAGEKSNVLRSTHLEARIAELEKRSKAEEDAASSASLTAQIGETLAANGGTKKLDGMLREWDPNGDGSVTKQEFRLNVRKIFPKKKPDPLETDELFNSLDADGGGELDMKELKAALKQMIDAHNNRKKAGSAALANAKSLRGKAMALKDGEALSAARASEAMCVKLEEMRNSSTVESKLGDFINSKGMKAGDVAKKWDTSGDGELDKKEFRKSVLGLGFAANEAAVDTLFDSLDIDRSGKINIQELQKALKRFTEQSNARTDLLKTTGIELRDAFKRLRRAQAEYKAQQMMEEESRADASQAQQAANTTAQKSAKTVTDKAAKGPAKPSGMKMASVVKL
jgi:Ca2+-binding EF-hand superfamily protein